MPPARDTPRERIANDAMHRAAILCAVAAGAVGTVDAARAVGYLPGELERDLLECATHGAELVRQAITHGVVIKPLWNQNVRDYQAIAGTGTPKPAGKVIIPVARLKPPRG